MRKTIALLAAAVTCVPCVDWTRLSGTVKAINLMNETVTIENKQGDLLIVPLDYQVKIADKDGTLIDIKRLSLDEKITLTRTPQALAVEDMTGMAQPEPSQRGDK